MKYSGIFMSIRDARNSQIAIGCFLLVLSVPALATGKDLTEVQGRDPFSNDRSANNVVDYPSVLTSPEFESSVTGTVAPAVPGSSLTESKMLKTPVIPVTSTGIAPTKNYALVRPSASNSARALILHENVLLSIGLNQWAKDSGYKMLWNSSKDYLIYSTITYSGTTADDVLGDLGKLFASENYGLVIKLYQKNNVLVVDEQ